MKRLFLSVAFALMACAPILAQSGEVKREGVTFVEVQSDKVSLDGCTKTKYTYKTKDGREYPIYISKSGKAFIVRVSKKSGKEYKQYLPQVTNQLNNGGK